MSGTQSSTVTPGNWIIQTVNGMQYMVLLPANYDPSIKYSTVLYLHQLDEGSYGPSLLQTEINPWFNTTEFRTDHPSIIVAPLLDQTADPSGETINFGGVSTADTAGEDNALAALAQVQAQYSTDPTRTYVTGNSMGGIGTEDMIVKYNAYTGTEGKIFAAGLSLAGADYGQGYPQPDQSVVTALKNVPFMAIHGGQDTQVPLAWDQNLYAAEQAIGGDMIYTQDNSLGHDVWDTYYPQTGPSSPLSWLFDQSTGGTVTTPTPTPSPTPTPTATPSPNDTVVNGTTGAITDASGNKWTITAGGQVAINGTLDTTTKGVVELAYVDGTIWQENTSNLWWGETQNNASWAPTAGTATSPLPATPTPAPTPTPTPTPTPAPTPTPTPTPTPPPTPTPTPTPTASPNDTVVKGTTGTITDASGNKWTITAGGQVAINSAADPTTKGVIELAYVSGTIWQENTSNLWWGETKNNASWAPTAGTSTSPLPATATPTATASPNDTMVLAGATNAITDGTSAKWTITASGQVAVNGTADTTTTNVSELGYVNKEVWQENTSGMWYGKTSTTAAWSAGTTSSPLPAPITIAVGTTSTTVTQSEVSITATSGSHMLFVSGSGDIVSLSGGTNTITDSGSGNTYILPSAGNGTDAFSSNILTTGDTLDLKTALAATNWTGSSATLANYLTVTDSAKAATLSISATSGGSATAVATIDGASTATLTSLLAHAIT